MASLMQNIPPNIPWALGLCTIGLRLAFQSTPNQPSPFYLPSSSPPPPPQTPLDTTVLGVVTTGYGLGFALTAYASPPATNQMLQLWLPLQAGLAVLAEVVLVFHRPKRADRVTRTGVRVFIGGVLTQMATRWIVYRDTGVNIGEGWNKLWELFANGGLSLSNVNLPWPILIHAIALLVAGCVSTMTFPPTKTPEVIDYSDAPVSIRDQYAELSNGVPPEKLVRYHHPSEADSTLAGLASIGLGTLYLVTAQLPMDQNQFLWASGPVRVLLACLASTLLYIKTGMTKKLKLALWGIAIYDGLEGAAMAWWLGSWSGRAPVV
ncbi:MAG: hypothetical protein M1833_005801 [Piccolia ochrophora]|nr:MAG: hypothetical protein M1833_005801 [Piccolia ochrophora]